MVCTTALMAMRILTLWLWSLERNCRVGVGERAKSVCRCKKRVSLAQRDQAKKLRGVREEVRGGVWRGKEAHLCPGAKARLAQLDQLVGRGVGLLDELLQVLTL
jgi:hypothetical protein